MPTLTPSSSEEMLESVYTEILQLIENNKFVVTLGGEHSISFPSIKAHSQLFSSISVLQLDAHADLQDEYEGNPWSHACVMARVTELPAINKIISVGIRSMSFEEKKNLRLTVPFFCHSLFASEDWMTDVLNSLSSQVYITIDLDVFDSSIMPSTGTPEPGGLNWMQVTKLLKRIAQHRTIVGCDVVELCPNVHNTAPDFLAAKLVYKLLSYKYMFDREG